MPQSELEILLNKKAKYYNQSTFITNDPICVPHQYTIKQDIEIAGFFAAIFAWGQRTTIINKAKEVMLLLGNSPYSFIMQPNFTKQLEVMLTQSNFVHRTFNKSDLQHLLLFLHFHYYTIGEQSLETAFTKKYNYNYNNPQLLPQKKLDITQCLTNFHNYVFGFSEDATLETHCKKHIATPAKNSACKRLCMYLRWMVRKDDSRVDFGIWHTLKPHQLVCPLDVHVGNIARQVGLLTSPNNDWQAAVALTSKLSMYCKADPTKYDFALFSMGVVENKTLKLT